MYQRRPRRKQKFLHRQTLWLSKEVVYAKQKSQRSRDFGFWLPLNEM